MAAGVAQLRPGGVLAALVPAGWLGGSYFQRLRAHLAAEAPLHRLTYVRERADVFSTGVLQETVLASFVRGTAPRELGAARRRQGFPRDRELLPSRLIDHTPVVVAESDDLGTAGRGEVIG